jgi:hypothetical protein
MLSSSRRQLLCSPQQLVQAGTHANWRPAAEAKSRKARQQQEKPARRSQSPQQIASAQTSFVTACAAGPAAVYPAPHHSGHVPAVAGKPFSTQKSSVSSGLLSGSGGLARLDGLQMQMAGRNSMLINILGATVLLQPVTRAQAVWTGGTAHTPTVALCVIRFSLQVPLGTPPALSPGVLHSEPFAQPSPCCLSHQQESSLQQVFADERPLLCPLQLCIRHSCIAAASNIPDPAVAWFFPTSNSAAWDSGRSWTLLFTQQAQHKAFRGMPAA